MKNTKKFLALALVIVSVFAIALPAFAADTITLDVAPGGNPRTAGYDSNSFTCKCTLAGSGDTVRVFLDTFSTSRNDWVERKSYKFTSSGSTTLSYTLNSTNTKARIRTYGYKENSGTATVVVSVN